MKEINNNCNNLGDLEQFLDISNQVAENYRSLEEADKSIAWATKQLKDEFGELGKMKGYKVSSSIHGGEKVFDFMWYEVDEKQALKDVHLILESELSSRKWDGLKFDFEKLLLANSEIKIFICFNEGNGDFPNNINRLIDKLNYSVSSFKGMAVGGKVLILIWDDYETGKFYAHLITKD